jgi:hypothetical protein
MVILSLEQQGIYDATDAGWAPAADRTSQCRLEVMLHTVPEGLSEIGIAQAKLETGNKETSKWGKGITK